MNLITVRRRVTAAGTSETGTSEPGFDVYERTAVAAGPRVVVLGGVHGDEVGGIVAAGRIATTEWPLERGSLVVVPVAHEAAHTADRRESPLDGGNLARSFPGDQAGTPTERLARLLLDEVIAEADVLIDLHTSNPATDMPLFVGCLDDGSAHGDAAVRLAAGFGFDLVWTHPSLGPGRTLTVAAERGIPALYVESPVGGVLDERYVSAYVDGVRSVLEALGLLSPARERPQPTTWLHGDGDVDGFTAAGVDGLFERTVALLDEVRTGQPIGRILGGPGEILEEVRAPASGLVTTLQRAAAVARGRPLVGVTPRRPTRLGIPTDEHLQHTNTRSTS